MIRNMMEGNTGIWDPAIDGRFLNEQRYITLLAIYLKDHEGESYLEKLKGFLDEYGITEDTNPHLWFFFMEKWL